MNAKTLFATLAIAAVTASQVAGLDFMDVRVTGMNYNPYPALPGAYMDMYIQLYNAGTTSAKSVEFTLEPRFPFSLEPGAQTHYSFPEIGPGSSALLQYRVIVDAQAVDGTNDLAYSWSTTGATKSSAKFKISVSKQSLLEIESVNPTLLSPGVPTDIAFTIKNVGTSSVNQLVFSWSESTKVIVPLGSDSKKFVDKLAPNDSATITFKTVAGPTATAGVYLLNLTAAYMSGNSTQSYSTTTGMLVGSDAMLDAAMQDYSGGTLSIAIANVGNSDAAAVSVTIPNQPGIRVTGSSTRFLGNLQQGDFTIASFTATPNTNAAGINATQRPALANTTGPGQNAGSLTNRGMRPGGNSTTGGVAVIISYTDNLGARHSQTKTIQFDATSSAGALAAAAGQLRNRQNTDYSFYAYTGAGVVLLAAGYWYYRKRKAVKK